MKKTRPITATSRPIAPPVLTVAELAMYLRVHPTTIDRLLRTKQLPGFRVGSEWRFDSEMIEQRSLGADYGTILAKRTP